MNTLTNIKWGKGERHTVWIYSVNLRIQSEYRKMRTRTNSVFGHFSRSGSNVNSQQKEHDDVSYRVMMWNKEWSPLYNLTNILLHLYSLDITYCHSLLNSVCLFLFIYHILYSMVFLSWDWLLWRMCFPVNFVISQRLFLQMLNSRCPDSFHPRESEGRYLHHPHEMR